MALKWWEQPARKTAEQRRQEAAANFNEDEFFSFTEFNKDIHYVTRAALLYRFYERNNFEGGCNAWIAMVLDPPDYTPPGSHTWWLVHYHGYFARVDLSFRGPNAVHRVRLFYKQEATQQTLWLASCQLGPCYFYSQADMAMQYMMLLAKKEFFQTEKDAKQIVAL